MRSSGRRIVFIGLTGTMLTEDAVGSLVGALRSFPPHDAAEEPETLEVLCVQMSECGLRFLSADVQSGVNVLLSRPNWQALRAAVPNHTRDLCQKARERRSSRRATKPA